MPNRDVSNPRNLKNGQGIRKYGVRDAVSRVESVDIASTGYDVGK
jgi:hypothetical protein